MRTGRQRWIFRVAILLVGGLALLVWAILEQTPTTLVIENRSGQPIATLDVRLDGEARIFQDIPAGKTVSIPLGENRDATLAVKGQLANGNAIRFNSLLRNLLATSRPRLVVERDGIKSVGKGSG